MELLIKDLLIIFSLIHSSITESYRSTESSKGIYSIYIYDFPYWILNIITNDFINLNYIDKLCHYTNIGDLIAVLGSIDSVSGSVDSVFATIAVLENRNEVLRQQQPTYIISFFQLFSSLLRTNVSCLFRVFS